jgi:WD40 repeat protein
MITRRAAYLTPDGAWAIFSVDDQHLQVVDLASLATTHTLPCDSPQVVAVTPGRVAHPTGGDGDCVASPTGREGGSVASPIEKEGERAVAVTFDNTLTTWDLEHGEEHAFPTGHNWPVTGLAISPDGRYAATVAGFGRYKTGGGPDRTLKVWSIPDGALVASFTGESALGDCAILEDGVTFVAGPHILRLEDVQPGIQEASD